jgi:hypothetical protein
MPAPVPLPLRQRLWQLAQRGLAAADRAARFRLPLRTVQHLRRRLRRARGTLRPAYRPGPGRPRWAGDPLPAQALALRQAHPARGAGYIRVRRRDAHPDTPLPSVRTRARWFARPSPRPAPPGPRPQADSRRAAQPHEVWPRDAADQLRLRGGPGACWLRLVEECSGAFLPTVVSPQRYGAHVSDAWVQAQLRQAFTRWGLPARRRGDNGKPWGSGSDLPTPLALWRIGLGIELLGNPPRQPQPHGVVERSPGTAKRWGDPGSCDDVGPRQQQLAEADRRQRELYPSVGAPSRGQVWPGLRHSGRPYAAAQEEGQWRREAVGEHRAGYAASRRGDGTGQVSAYDRNYSVGVRHRGREVYVPFDPQRRAWLFCDRQGQCLRSQPAVGIEAQTIRALPLPGPKRKRR